MEFVAGVIVGMVIGAIWKDAIESLLIKILDKAFKIKV
jgi:hypothetical protein